MSFWTAKDVKFELVKAYRVLASVPARDSFYMAGGGFWPAHTYEAEEIEAQREQEIADNRSLKPVRGQYTPRDIKRMEQVLLGEGGRKGWLVEFVKDQSAAKRCLTRWAIWVSQDRNVRSECICKGWAYSTFRRRRDQGAQALADALNAAGVQLA